MHPLILQLQKFYPLKTIELIPSNLKITQSYDKYALNNKNTDKTNDDEQSNYFRRTYKFTSCERYGKKKIMLKYLLNLQKLLKKTEFIKYTQIILKNGMRFHHMHF